MGTDAPGARERIEAMSKAIPSGDDVMRRFWALGYNKALSDVLTNLARQPKCLCDIRTRLVGDGCEVCNPEMAADLDSEPSAASGPVPSKGVCTCAVHDVEYIDGCPRCALIGAEQIALAARSGGATS